MSALFSKGKDEKSQLGSQSNFPNPRDNISSYNDLDQALNDFKEGNGDREDKENANPGAKGKLKAESEAQSKIAAHSFNVVNSRLTLLEDRYNTVRERLSFAERTLIDNRESTNKKIKVLDAELNDLNSEMNDLRESVETLQDEIKRAAKESDVKVIGKYLDLLEPLEFVTREEVKKALKRIRSAPNLDEDVALHE